MNLPDPLIAADTDIAGFDCFMLNVNRLFSSELWALSTGEEFKAAVALWGKAWQQSPPGSLPNDDRLLASFSGAGARWKKIKAMALRGFVECSDGRLYNKTLCEDVKRAAQHKADQKARTAKATEARRKKVEQPTDTAPSPPDPDPSSRDRDVVATDHVTTTVTSTNRQDGTGQDRIKESAAQPLSNARPRIEDQCDSPGKPLPSSHADPVMDLRMKIAGIFTAAQQAAPSTLQADVWLAQGYSADLILSVIRAKFKPGKSLVWYTPAIAEAAAVKAPAAPEAKPVSDDSWRNLLFAYHKTGRWAEVLGPPPGSPGCKVPSHLLEEAA